MMVVQVVYSCHERLGYTRRQKKERVGATGSDKFAKVEPVRSRGIQVLPRTCTAEAQIQVLHAIW
jgi:hypothetical protein